MALYNYTGEVGDLSFSEGDVIKVHKDEGEWWEGSCRGEQGLFPANYVKKKDTEVTVWQWYPCSLTFIQYMYVMRETSDISTTDLLYFQVPKAAPRTKPGKIFWKKVARLILTW